MIYTNIICINRKKIVLLQVFMKDNLQITTADFNVESKVIELMRFPLAVLVVFVHTPRQTGILIEWIWSDAIASMAVPVFFVLSGFLYFHNINHPNRPQEWYVHKTVSRIRSIVIPYLFWALLPVIIFCIRKIVGMIIHWHGPEMLFDGLSRLNFYHILWESGNGGPENLPLWFLRDLLVVNIFTPPLYYFLKHLKYCSLPLLLFASIFNLWIPWPGFSATVTFFFSLGAWCSIHKVSMFQLGKFLFLPSAVLSIIGIILLYFKIIPLFIFNVIALPLYMYGMWLLFSKKSIKPMPIITKATMFIYVAHGNLIAHPNVWKLVQNILPSNMIGELIGYFIIPTLTIMVLIFTHWGLRRIAPRTMNIICGR